MRIDLKRSLLAAGVSAVFLAGLVWFARTQDIDLSTLDPLRIAALTGVYGLLTMSRGLLLRSLAPEPDRGSFAPWFNLAARHQIVFTLVPSGAGDIGFPYLLNRTTGLSMATGVRIIAQFRLRDAAMLASLGAVGLLATGFSPFWGILGLFAAVCVLWFVDDIAMLALTLASRLPGGRLAAFLKSALPEAPLPLKQRLSCTFLSLVVWTIAALGLALAFLTAGHPLSLGEVLLVLVMLNAIGAVAVSVAGLGVSEAGVAGALIAMGTSAPQAAAIAIVARPLMLVSLISASALLDLATGLFCRHRWFNGVSRP